ncbi:hypothetical protein LV89_04627 [Arcicella aurantiaca]|uniref:CRISPR-associated protein Csx10 n=1 Tax=Arcicella aurantiaca TaxID=591202 RepID=A0A316DIB8_9BACT|nr:hypothetical protein [Arcicella aurantiaca]PWK16969.1 hypothetical protein LV89_04627 [Arcicella aurantiaca]
MKEQYYTCTLLSDVVLNNKMATEGNMTTLDYIAGSNFLGIVANDIYKNHKEKAYKILHAGEVSFGDAHISLDDKGTEVSYAMPFSLFKDKLDKTKTWVHHLLDKHHFDNFREKGIQLKQERNGYLTPSGHLLKSPEKNFVLKSAQDRDERRSKDGAMFGFESLKAGQVYIFSVRYHNAEYQKIVEDFLLGNKRIGKSKTAQYGQVCIKKFKDEQAPKKIDSISNTNYTIVYAESNLCFFNEFGQTTFQPKPKDLGLTGGKICWKKSQIRTYAYSPWNGIRNTPNTQRDCILKGSVFYVEGAVAPEKKTDNVGEYQAEGLGRVIYNPKFLKGNQSTGEWEFDFLNDEDKNSNKGEQKNNDNPNPVNTPLGRFLKVQFDVKNHELKLSESVHLSIHEKQENKTDEYKFTQELRTKDISPSQWGNIRQEALNADSLEALVIKLFFNSKTIGEFIAKHISETEKLEDDLEKNNENILDFLQRVKNLIATTSSTFQGTLTYGNSAEKSWDFKSGVRRNELFSLIKLNHSFGTVFVSKFAAEMAKISQNLKNTNEK